MGDGPMTATGPRLFDLVRIGESDDARALELVGAEGVVLGRSEDATTGETWFAVQVGGLPAVMLPSGNLIPTGRSVPPTSVYVGGHLRVSEEGRIIADDPSRFPPSVEGA